MKQCRTNERIVLGICAAAGLLLIAGCESSRKEPDHHWTPIARSADAVVSNNTKITHGTSAQGVSKSRLVSQSASSSLFSDYDRAFVDAVETRWGDILDTGSFSPKKGQVVLQFTLHSNGAVSDVLVLTNTASDLAAAICRKAILDSAPYPPWSADMRKKAGDTRVITINFRYE